MTRLMDLNVKQNGFKSCVRSIMGEQVHKILFENCMTIEKVLRERFAAAANSVHKLTFWQAADKKNCCCKFGEIVYRGAESTL